MLPPAFFLVDTENIKPEKPILILWIRKIGFRALSNRAGEVEAPVNCRDKQEVTKPVDSAPLAAHVRSPHGFQ
jgi:hypothetical protein